MISEFARSCAALHSLILPSDPSESSSVRTLPTTHPILDFDILPSQPGRLLVSLDTAWAKLRENPSPENMRGIVKDTTLSEDNIGEMKRSLRLVEVASSGEVSCIFHKPGM